MENRYVIKDGQNYIVTSHAAYPVKGYGYFNPYSATTWPTKEAALAVVESSGLCDVAPPCQVVAVSDIEGATPLSENRISLPRPERQVEEHAAPEPPTVEALAERVANLQKAVQPHRGYWWT